MAARPVHVTSPRRFAPATTVVNLDAAVHQDLVRPRFDTTVLNPVWTSDTTCQRTGQGTLDNDEERSLPRWTTQRAERAVPMPVEPTTLHRTRRYFPTWLPPRRFIAALIAIGGMQLMAGMDGTIAIVALPKIQNELGLSGAGRSWVITASMLTFGGLMLEE